VRYAQLIIPSYVGNLTGFTRLSRLILSSNELSVIPYISQSEPLPWRFLSLTSTRISSWASVDALSVWCPQLEGLSLHGTPLVHGLFRCCVANPCKRILPPQIPKTHASGDKSPSRAYPRFVLSTAPQWAPSTRACILYLTASNLRCRTGNGPTLNCFTSPWLRGLNTSRKKNASKHTLVGPSSVRVSQKNYGSHFNPTSACVRADQSTAILRTLCL
jgi:hypothetical protein